MARLTKELASSSDSLKVALDANFVQGKALRKAKAERETLRVKLEASERKVRELTAELKKSEDNFVEGTSAHDKVISEKTWLEMELNDLKDYVLKVHSQSFKQASAKQSCCMASLGRTKWMKTRTCSMGA